MMRRLARRSLREALRARPVEPYEPDAKRLLLIRPDHLGDLLFVRPGLERLRKQLPDWQFTLMIGPWSEAIVEGDPHVDQILTFPFPGFTRETSGNPVEPYRLLFEAARQIRELGPAAAVILRDDHWWGALAARQAGVPVIVGSDHPAMRDLVTVSAPVDRLHAVVRNAVLLDAASRRLGSTIELPRADTGNAPLVWNIGESDRQRAHQLLADIGIDRRYVVIHPGSGAPVKLWPAERWARVADWLDRSGYAVVLSGSTTEMPLLQRIAALTTTPTFSLGGKTSIRELASVFEQSRTVIGVDSGPLHLAVAVDTSSVHLYGPSDVSTYGPWGDPTRHRVVKAAMSCPDCGNLALSRPEGAGCMLAIGVDDAIDAIRGLVRE